MLPIRARLAGAGVSFSIRQSPLLCLCSSVWATAILTSSKSTRLMNAVSVSTKVQVRGPTSYCRNDSAVQLCNSSAFPELL